MRYSRITSKGQITVPKAVRERLGVEPGDRIAFRVEEDGRVYVEAESVDLRSLRGALAPRQTGVSVDQMTEAIRTRAGGAARQ